jgi:hypothetical protein
MLRNEYNQWSANNGSNGFFPELFNESWVTLFEKNTSIVNFVKADSPNDRLPSVSLSYGFDKKKYCMSVLNSSSFFKSHVLKCYKIDKGINLSGKYSYFEGELKFNS